MNCIIKIVEVHGLDMPSRKEERKANGYAREFLKIA